MANFAKIVLQNDTIVIINLDQVISIEKNNTSGSATLIMPNDVKYYTKSKYEDFIQIGWLNFVD